MAERGFDLRIAFYQRFEKSAQAQEFRIEDGADTQLAMHRIAHRGGRAFDIVGAAERTLGQGEKRLAVAGQGQAVRATREQRQIEGFLQMLDTQADGRLRQVQGAGRPG